MKLNFKRYEAAQDMISIIMRTKALSINDAIDFSINIATYHEIIAAGWADIALGLWGHGDPEREWVTLPEPCVTVEFSDEKRDIINKIAVKYDIKTETAISYFLIFTMAALGYHI